MDIFIGIRRLCPNRLLPLFQNISSALQVYTIRVNRRNHMEIFHKLAKCLIVSFDGIAAGFLPSGAVACTAKRIAVSQSAQQITRAAHRPRNHHRFTIIGKRCPCHLLAAAGTASPLSMNIIILTVNLLFPDIIVRRIIKQRHITRAQHLCKNLLNHKAEKQTVCKAKIRSIAGRGPEPVPCILLFIRFWNRINLVLWLHQPNRINLLTNLTVQKATVMPDCQRTRVQHDRHSAFFQIPCIRSLTVVNLSNPLYLQKMISAANRPDLVIIGQLSIAAYEILQAFCGCRLNAAAKYSPAQPFLLNLWLIIAPQPTHTTVMIRLQQSLKPIAKQRLPLSPRHRNLSAALKKDVAKLFG